MPYLFVFGNTPQLSSLELTSVFESENLQNTTLCENLLGRVVELGDFDQKKLFGRLGGTVKLAKILGNVESLEDLDDIDVGTIVQDKKINFGLSVYGPGVSLNEIKIVCEFFKAKLRSSGHVVRYVLPTEGTVLSSVVVEKQKVVELILFFDQTSGQYYLAHTLEVSDFAGWNHRDYDRPKVDPHVGMMPPRVARMMTNIAVSGKQSADSFTILDPFCGVGTILSEALMVGVNVVGSDLDKRQVAATKTNLDWLITNYQLRITNYQVLEADARVVSTKFGAKKVDAIVTEPDLGPNLGTSNNKSPMTNTWARLEQLYLECLRDWQKLLNPGGRVVIALPSFFGPNGAEDRSLVTHVVDKARVMGYSVKTELVLYRRPQANVGRNITIFSIS